MLDTDRDAIRKWVVNHQHALVVRRYTDVKQGQEIVDFFAKYLYPSFEDRDEAIARNEFIRRILKIYQRGKLHKELGAAVVIYAPMIWLADRMVDLPQYLERAVALYDQAEEMDTRIVEYALERGAGPEQLNAAFYDQAFRETSTLAERVAQVNEVIDVGGFAVSVVERGGIANLILRYVPRVPLFAGNPTVRGLNAALTMVQAGFRAFRNQADCIHELKELTRTRELDAVQAIFEHNKVDCSE